VHFLPLQNIDQLHLLFERTQQFVSLPLQLLVLVGHSVQVSPDLLVLRHLVQFGLPQLKLQLFNLFQSPIQLSFLVAHFLGVASQLVLSRVQLPAPLFYLPLEPIDLLLLLCVLRLLLRELQLKLVDLLEVFLLLRGLFLRPVRLLHTLRVLFLRQLRESLFQFGLKRRYFCFLELDCLLLLTDASLVVFFDRVFVVGLLGLLSLLA
jgi:hypothetical protein